MLCKKCHTEMTVMQEDNVNGLICPKCGWKIGIKFEYYQKYRGCGVYFCGGND